MHRTSASYKIHGEDIQFLTVALSATQNLFAEQSSVVFMSTSVQWAPDVPRLATGADPFLTGWFFGDPERQKNGLLRFTGTDTSQGMLSISSGKPGRIIALDLESGKTPIICRSGALLAMSGDMRVRADKTNEKTAANPIWLQKINGAGLCFLRARGRMMRIPVNNQTIRIHPNALVAYESTLNLEFIDVASKDDFLSISGEGKVWLQSSW